MYHPGGPARSLKRQPPYKPAPAHFCPLVLPRVPRPRISACTMLQLPSGLPYSSMFSPAGSLLKILQFECKPCLRSQLSQQLATSFRKASTSPPVAFSTAQGRSQAVKGSSRNPTGPPPTIKQVILPPPESSATPSKPSSKAKDKDHTPKPLLRPLGQSNPPRPGENSGIDPRTWRERRDDFLNYDKHLERRKQLFVSLFSFISFTQARGI